MKTMCITRKLSAIRILVLLDFVVIFVNCLALRSVEYVRMSNEKFVNAVPNTSSESASIKVKVVPPGSHISDLLDNIRSSCPRSLQAQSPDTLRRRPPTGIIDVEQVIQEITASFISILKTDEYWLRWLLNYIKKEQKLRLVNRCYSEVCLYKIPCYLSRRFFEKGPAVNKTRANGFREIVRRRRDTEILKSNGIANNFTINTTTEAQLLNNLSVRNLTLNAADINVTLAELENISSTPVLLTIEKLENLETEAIVELDTENEDDTDLLYLISNNSGMDSPMVNCSGIYTDYCFNSFSCMYVKVLEAAVCYCKPGYTGMRCDLYNLPQTLDTLNEFRDGTVDIYRLTPSESAKLYSVLEATARYTYNAVLEEEQSLYVKKPNFIEAK